MDDTRFDALARSLTIGRSRRGALAAVVGGALGVAGLAGTDAKRKKKPCPPCKRRKKGKCKVNVVDGTACSGGRCQGGSCVADPPPFVCPPQRVCGPGCCPEGKVCGSNGACVDPSCCSDNAVCGAMTTAGSLCCVAPRVAFCCCENPAGAGNGYMLCCNPNTGECPDNCSRGSAQAGTNGTTPNAAGVCPFTPRNVTAICG